MREENKIFISIIIPVYNCEKYIEKCIKSLMNQTYKDFEILLINDGSTDKSAEICSFYEKSNKNIKLFNIKNSGVSNARNYGIDYATGNYIQFVDSDDYVDSDYIESMVNAIKNTDEDIDIVICGIKQIILKNNEYIFSRDIKVESSDIYNIKELNDVMPELIEKAYINYCYSKLIKKDVIINNNIRFNKYLSLGEDTLFVLDILNSSKNIKILSNTPYNYVIHSDYSLTYKYRNDKFEILNMISNKIEMFCKNNMNKSQFLEKVLSKRYYEIIKFCLDENLKKNINISMYQRFINMKNILNNRDVHSFINKDNAFLDEISQCKRYSIKSRSVVIYVFIYYLSIVIKKLRGKLYEKNIISK